MNRHSIIAGIAASAVTTPANAECDTLARYQDALERIALLDEADGNELTVRQAFDAVAIASNALGKHPSQIAAERPAGGRCKKGR